MGRNGVFPANRGSRCRQRTRGSTLSLAAAPITTTRSDAGQSGDRVAASPMAITIRTRVPSRFGCRPHTAEDTVGRDEAWDAKDPAHSSPRASPSSPIWLLPPEFLLESVDSLNQIGSRLGRNDRLASESSYRLCGLISASAYCSSDGWHPAILCRLLAALAARPVANDRVDGIIGCAVRFTHDSRWLLLAQGSPICPHTFLREGTQAAAGSSCRCWR